jgi:uncharacterized membrane protein YfcA
MFRKHWNRRIFLIFGLPSIIATVIGASLAAQANPDLLKLILGIVLIIFAVYSLIHPVFIAKKNPWWGRVGGALS